MPYTKNFSEIRLTDLPQVGGKNSSLGEMFSQLTPKGILVPDGFAVTSAGYWYFLKEADLVSKLTSTIAKLDTSHFKNLHEIGAESRKMVLAAEFPESLKTEILRAYADLNKRAGSTVSLAVRSSATAEDLPNASFAGQQESYLNVSGEAI